MSHTFGVAGSIQAPPSSAGFLGQGVTYPLDYDSNTGRLRLSWGTKSVEDAVYSILLTEPGERIMLYDYGASRLTFEPLDVDRTRRLILNSVQAFEPRVTDARVDVTPGPEAGASRILVTVEIAGEATPRVVTYDWFKGPATTLPSGSAG